MTRHFGVLIPSTNTTAEIEYARLLPASLQPHYARLGKADGSPFAPSLDEDVAYQAKLLGNAKVGFIGLLQTSASMFEDGYDARIKALMSEHANAPAMTSAEAIGAAVQHLGARRIALVSPYSNEVIARTKRYYESRFDIVVLATAPFGATDAYAIGGLGAEHATEAFERIDSDEIEVMVVPGGNFPTMAHLPAWEAALGKPVITTNQALAWAAARELAFDGAIPGAGTLLAAATSA